MPIKMTYENCSNEVFVRALAKLAKYEGFKNKLFAYGIAKILRRFNTQSDLSQDKFIDLVKKFALLDENGKIKPQEGKPGTYEIPEEKQDAWKAAKSAFDQTEFEIDCHQIRLDQLEDCPLSPMDLTVLEPLIQEPEMIEKVLEDLAS